jgi:UDP-hydrolysing UDP-N-acetyl-D-glucosamine 2-epimerase
MAADRRTIAVVTVGRSDYGILTPVLEAIEQQKVLDLSLIVAGGHLSLAGGYSVKQIEADRWRVRDRIDMLVAGDGAEATAVAMGLGTIGFARAFARERPDIVLLLGDRFEMHAAAVAAVPFNIPIAHIHGGETTFGAIDDSFRHSISKISHLHFSATELFAKRLIAMGEEPWRVTVSGAPGLDVIKKEALPSRAALQERFAISLRIAPLLVTHHPVTRKADYGLDELRELLAALEVSSNPVVFTAPNVDPGHQAFRETIADFVSRSSRAWLVENFGSNFYLAMLRESQAMVGNSSSGIIEAASFKLPVVNIGNRQEGRPCGPNVMHAKPWRASIEQAIALATSKQFRDSLVGLENIYGDGHAGPRIAAKLAAIDLDHLLVAKRFHDVTP